MIKKIIVNLLRFAFAAVFIFSGYVKAIDPLGYTYKIEEYLEAFGGFTQNFSVLAFPFAVLNSSVELLIGITLLLGIYRKKTIVLAMLFMAVYTPLTLYIALFNPVTDCGCFGDALIIGNWTTFWKNIALDAIIILLFIYRKDIIPFIGNRTRCLAAAYALVFSVALSIYCYCHLPLVDFRPYKIGTNIPEKMVIPDDAPKDSIDYFVIMKKGAESKEFPLSEYTTAKDAGWEFVEQNNKVIREGYKPPIHDFSITVPEDGDVTEEVLADTNYTFLLISYKLEKASLQDSAEINRIYDYARANGYKFYCLHASLDEDVEDYIQYTGAKYPMATADETTLKTIIRSNPGLLLLKNGTIINKWSHNDLPAFTEPLANSELGKVQPNNGIEKTLMATGMLFVPVLILIICSIIAERRRKKSTT